MNKLKSANIYLGKYRENVFQCKNIVDINRYNNNKFS